MNPAKYVFEILGSIRETARVVGKNPGTVCRWGQSKEGRIPSECMGLLLKHAKKQRLDITAEDLILGRRG